jgi:hypothetical protein
VRETTQFRARVFERVLINIGAERVRFSWLLNVSMLYVALGVIINCLGLWQLENIDRKPAFWKTGSREDDS